MAPSYIGRVLLFFEAIWAIYWIVALFIFQFAQDSLLFRNTFAITALHAVNPVAIYSVTRAVEHGKIKLRGINFLIFGFGVATDLNSLLEAALHLTKEMGQYHLVRVMLGITSMALALSLLGFLWFTVLYFRGKGKTFERK